MNLVTREYGFRNFTFKVRCLDSPSDHGSSWSFIDEDSVRQRHWNVEKGDFIFDLGAAYGSYTLIALAMGASGAIAIGFQSPPVHREPGRQDNLISEADTFAASLEANGWRSKVKIDATNGLYSEAGWFDTQRSLFFREKPAGATWEIIRVVPLDSLVKPSDFSAKRYWMKLDVEGAEVHVLRGGEKLIRALRPRILVENHELHQKGIGQEVRSLLESWGFHHQLTETYSTAVSHSFYLP
jgi:FkbM family methyltransferase